MELQLACYFLNVGHSEWPTIDFALIKIQI